MARFEARSGPHGRQWVVVAETDAERELLAFCCLHQKSTLVLNDAYYPVQGELVIVPQTLSEEGARRICEALAWSADSHQRARTRRAQFSIINNSE